MEIHENSASSSDSANFEITRLEPVDEQLLLQDADELLAIFTNKKVPRTGAQRRELYRQRQQQERSHLKELVVTLTEQVEALRKENESSGSTLSITNWSRSTWRLIAMKERQRLFSAESLQKKLRAAVADQAALIVDLQFIFRKRMRRENQKSRGEIQALMEKRPRLEPTDGILLEAYLGELNITYRETDNVLASRLAPSGGFSSVMRDNGTVDFFEVPDVKHLPFGFQSVCDVIWEVVSLPHRQTERKLYNSSMSCENAFAVSFRVIFPREFCEELIVSTHFVARRYVEDARTVIVWRGIMEGDGEFAGIRMEETGWCIAYPIPGDFPGTYSTLVQKYARVVSLYYAAPQEKVDEFSRLMLHCIEEVDTTEAELFAKLAQIGASF